MQEGLLELSPKQNCCAIRRSKQALRVMFSDEPSAPDELCRLARPTSASHPKRTPPPLLEAAVFIGPGLRRDDQGGTSSPAQLPGVDHAVIIVDAAVIVA